MASSSGEIDNVCLTGGKNPSTFAFCCVMSITSSQGRQRGSRLSLLFHSEYLVRREVNKRFEPKSQASHILVPQLLAVSFFLSNLSAVVNLTPASYTGPAPSSGQLRLKPLSAVALRKTHQDRTKTCGTAWWVYHESFTYDNNQYSI